MVKILVGTTVKYISRDQHIIYHLADPSILNISGYFGCFNCVEHIRTWVAVKCTCFNLLS